METVDRKITDLIPAEYNPRYLTEEAFTHLSASLKRFGAVDPAIINIHPDRKNIIIGGHQRIKVARKLGWETFPCVEIKLDKEKERELNIRLNKNTGVFDFDMLADHFEVDELVEWGFTEEELFSYDENQFGEEFDLPDGEKEPFQQMTFTLADEQADFIRERIAEIKKTDEYKYAETFGNENSNGNALYLLCQK